MTEASPALWAVLNGAFDALRRTVEGVPDDAWGNPTPCGEWTARQVLEHAAGDQLAWAGVVSGSGARPDYNPFEPTGTIPGRPSELLEPALIASARAWAGVPATAEQVATPLPQGSLPPEYAVSACAMDAAVHAWDIARATGQPAPFNDELAVALMPAAHVLAEPLRDYGVFAAAVESEPSETRTDRLLRFLGRDPHWTPAAV